MTDEYMMTIQGTLSNGAMTIDSTNVRVPNTAPTATSLSLTDTPTSAVKGDTLTLNYTYYDEENNNDSSVDVEDGTTFKWYIADNPSGTTPSEIAGATSTTYTVTSSEEGKYIGFSVTPKNANGTGEETFLSTFIEVTDTTAPTLFESTPSDGATDVAVNSNITLVFSEDITLGSSGTIKIVDDTDNSTTVTIDLANYSDSELSETDGGNELIINPISDLSVNKTYHIEISEGVLKDYANNPNEANSSLISFKTPDDIAPTLLSSTPADDSTAFEPSADIVLTFDEDVQYSEDPGNITIFDTNDNQIEVIDIEDTGIVTFNSKTVTIALSSGTLDFETEYYIKIDSNTIVDKSKDHNAYAGINDTTTLNFKTKAPSVDLTSVVNAGKWNMVTVPKERNVNASDISGATIWTFNEDWEQAITLEPYKGYWLYTDDKTGYDAIPAEVIVSNGRSLRSPYQDFQIIKAVPDDTWTMVGISNETRGFEWSDIYDYDNTLKEGCTYVQIFHYDSNNSSWNTSEKVPYLGGIWVKQSLCSNET